MAWMTKFIIGRFASGLSKKDLRDVVVKLNGKLSQTDQKAIIRLAKDPKRTAESNDEMLRNAIQEIADKQNGTITVDDLMDLFENKHNFQFVTFYKRSTPAIRKARTF